MVVLDLFCGAGGWSRGFARRGWTCVGVDVKAHGYPFEFIADDVRNLPASFIDRFDAVVSSPPCEEFARACLPWIKQSTPSALSIELLQWSVDQTRRKNRVTECSVFATRFVPGAVVTDSWALWGDIPLLLPRLVRDKERKSGLNPANRALIPEHLADWFASYFARVY